MAHYGELYVVPQPERRRGIELNTHATIALRSAQRYRDRNGLDKALGLTTVLDNEGVELFIANRVAKRRLREIHHGERALAYLQTDEAVEVQIEQLIELYKKDYPAESSRALQIQNGVNHMFTQAEGTHVSLLPRRARRQFMELGEHWRGVLAGGQ